MARGRVRDKRKEALWRRVVGRQGRSGETVRGFCRKEGLRESAFYFWRRELARREAPWEQAGQAGRPPERSRRAGAGRRGPGTGRKMAAPTSATFVPVRLVPGATAWATVQAAAAVTAGPSAAAGVVGRIEIVLGDGRRVRVAGPVDREALAAVLAVLEGRPSFTEATEGGPC